MTVVARMLTQEQDGIPGYMAHPEGSGRAPASSWRITPMVSPPTS